MKLVSDGAAVQPMDSNIRRVNSRVSRLMVRSRSTRSRSPTVASAAAIAS